MMTQKPDKAHCASCDKEIEIPAAVVRILAKLEKNSRPFTCSECAVDRGGAANGK